MKTIKEPKTLRESTTEWLFQQIAIEKEKQDKQESSAILEKLFESVEDIEIKLDSCTLNML